MHSLAIVIPAFKETYFRKALDSLKNQTNKKFSVYIGDDNSPHNLWSIAQEYSNELNITYVKFDNNIGSEYLENQWTRCIALTKEEKWLWLFSDDDLVDKNAVEKFYSTLEANQDRFDVYRFNTCVIDASDRVAPGAIIGPAEESSVQMAFNLLLGNRGNSMPDHIFSREIYLAQGGFVFTQFAQAADWATSILFSQKKGMCIIPDAKMYWRLSGTNISSGASKNKGKMLIGHFQFVAWIVNHFSFLINEPADGITYQMMKSAARENLRNVICWHYKGINILNTIKLFKLLTGPLGVSPKDAMLEIYNIKKVTSTSFVRYCYLLARIRKRLLIMNESTAD